MMHKIDQVEAAIIQRIRDAAFPWLRFVGSYGGELVGDWQEVVRALPAVWVAFQNVSEPRPRDTAQTRFEAWMQFSVIVASRSVRSEAAARSGGPTGTPYVGTYAMLRDIGELICMKDFGLDGVDYLRPGRIRTLFSAKVASQAMSVLAQEWAARFVFTLREPGQRPLGTPEDGYLPPEVESSPLPEMRGMALRYWCKPPQDPTVDEPLLTDILPRISINLYEELR